MIQEIIVQFIIWSSVAYTLYNLIKLFSFANQTNKHQSCTGCSSCEVKQDLLVNISKQKKQQ